MSELEHQERVYIAKLHQAFRLFAPESPETSSESSSPGEKASPGDLSNPSVYSILSIISPSPSLPVLHSSPCPFFSL